MPNKLKDSKQPKNLEDYQPGASQATVFAILKKVIKSPKTSRKRGEQPAPTL
jgi:hypothetical protein